MTNNNLPNASIAGAGTISGGEYNAVRCSGSVKITGNIKCNSFSCSGATKAEGAIECSEQIKASGSFKAEGGAKADSIHGSGAVKFGDSLVARTVKFSGAIRVDGDISAEFVDIAGAFTVTGLINGEMVEIRMDGNNSDSHAGSVGGGKVNVKCNQKVSVFGFLKKKKSFLKTSVIEADAVDLENTIAETVRTIDAKICGGCEIGTLEYSGKLDLNKDAKVGKLIKI